ncbi:hypothetical protein BURK2_00166 [Burkholderiales bacterium]|nr:MAG: hypothetical protein F9K47_13145 [Burkholderiales bacterium]CAG0950498.1 hypothetical protein BURK2_00166 [Burkholderiales bacterium]
MRTLTLLALALLATGLLVGFFVDAEWECGIRYESPKILSAAGQAIAVEGGGVVTEGALLVSEGMNLGDGRLRPPMLSTNIFGMGEYRFAYTGRVEVLRIELDGREVYMGAPVTALRTGPGAVAFELRDEWPMGLIARDRCSLRSQWRGFFGG